jgi:hypothetical protein
MMSNAALKQLTEASESLRCPVSFDEFLAKLSPKDRANAEKRIDVLQAAASPGLVELWRRLACSLMTLAPHAAKLVGKQTVQYYVADGKYRMQVFALEDLQDGNMTVYCPDVLTEAIDAGLLAGPTTTTGGTTSGMYGIVGTLHSLRIDALDRDSLNPAAHFKDMVGWNRRALRLTLPPTASAEQVAAVELLCAVAAKRFTPPAATTTTTPPSSA